MDFTIQSVWDGEGARLGVLAAPVVNLERGTSNTEQRQLADFAYSNATPTPYNRLRKPWTEHQTFLNVHTLWTGLLLL